VSMAELLVFMVILGIAFLQLLARFLGRLPVTEAEVKPEAQPERKRERSSAESGARSSAKSQQLPLFAESRESDLPRISPPARSGLPRANNQRRPDVELDGALWEPTLRMTLVGESSRSSLRRAIALMAILGPPRALDPGECHEP
jgi:hypothetical protein